jgi:SAM-dependent methyltransferase
MTLGRVPARSREEWRSLRRRLSPHYAVELEAAVGEPTTLLDVGCGACSPVRAFTRRIPHAVGVEGYEPALLASKAAGIHDEYHRLDVRRLADQFEPESFDVVLAVDLLEHLSSEDGLALLSTMETIARVRVVVFTPNGFVPQGDVGGNPLQVHHSGWRLSTLRSLGYDAIGLHGLRFLRDEEASIRWRPRRAWSLVSDLTQPIARRVPSTAYHLLAIKQVSHSTPESPARHSALD